MKIEKVSDNQIRCTLTKEDLADRQLKLSELAYGTEKAKSLFRDMMQQASYEFGFEAEDIPLMIEAIPLSPDCIILIITKVEDPDELDTRFSKFAPANDSNISELENVVNTFAEGADDILDLFKKLHEEKSENNQKDSREFIPLPETLAAAKEKEPVEVSVAPMDITRMFFIESLDSATRIAQVLKGFYQGSNTLYKNMETKKYLLFLRKSEHTPAEFNKVCNILSEYAVPEKYTPAAEAYCEEHYKLILSGNALQRLAEI
ncbi:MAG: adaptor protein MecA [Lachnospiraceae bacterium]|nr:adaptor protein MecA [Lachnospiraceae bacterium]